jgi:hypothetical protein
VGNPSAWRKPSVITPGAQAKNGSKHGFDEGQALKLPSWLLSAAGAARPPAWSDNPAMLKKILCFPAEIVSRPRCEYQNQNLTKV